MRKLIHTCSFLFIFCFILAQYTHVYGQTFRHNTRSYSSNIIEASNLQSAGVITATGDFWDIKLNPAHGSNSIGKLKLKETRAYVKVFVDHNHPMAFARYTYRVLLNGKGYKDPANPTIYDALVDTLTISYDPDSIYAYQDMHIRSYYGYQKIEMEVVDVYDWTCYFPRSNSGVPPCTSSPPTNGFLTANGGGNFPQMATNWKLDVNVEDQHYDMELKDGASWKSAMANASLIVSKTAPAVGDNHLTISWKFLSGSNEMPDPYMCELEWAYVDNYAVTFSNADSRFVNSPVVTTKGLNAVYYDFTKNATRIITNKQEYKIPLIYKKGFIVYRVRLVRPDNTDYKDNVLGAWTIAADKGSVLSLVNIGSPYYEIDATKLHLADNYNWNYQATFAEDGKSKSVLTYYDGLLKNRQSVTKLNTLPSLQIVSETYYNHEGKPGLQTLPIPVQHTGLQFVNNFAYPDASSVAYNANDVGPAQLTVLKKLAPLSPAANYYSPLNSLYDAAPNSYWKYLQGLPDAEGFPLIHTRYASEDGRIIAQSGVGKQLQLGSGHETQNYYMSVDQFELDKYFGYNSGYAAYYEKIITRDPNKQHSFTILNNKGKTVMSGLMGFAPASPTSQLLLPDNVVLPSNSTANYGSVNLLEGHTPLWVGNVRKYNISRFMEAAGNQNMSFSLRLASYSPCNGAYLNIPLQYTIKMENDYGLPQMTPFTGTLGSLVHSTTSGTAHMLINASVPTYVGIGKNVINYEVSYNVADVEKAVDNLLFPPPPPGGFGTGGPTIPACIKSEGFFINEELAKVEGCDDEEEVIDDCQTLRQLLKSELYPNQKYGQYTYLGDDVTASTGLFAYNANHGYNYKNFLASNDIPDKGGYSRWDLVEMPVRTFIEIFNDDIAEMLLGIHPEYCSYKKIEFDCNGRDFIKKLSSINTHELASIFDYYPDGNANPLTKLSQKDPLYTFSDNGEKLRNVRIYVPASASFVSQRIDRLIFTKLFCTNSSCRDIVNSATYSEQKIRDLVLAASTEDRNNYIRELIQLYISNRSTVLERIKADSLYRGQCSVLPGTIAAVIAPQLVKSMYAATSNDLPMEEYIDLPGTYGTFTSNGAAAQSAISNDIYGSAANDNNGYNEYADQIIKRLVNCRNGNAVLNTATLKTSLVNYMTANGSADSRWKGGLGPDNLASILTTNGATLDDLCNPYLVDYWLMPDVKQNLSVCRETSFYTDVASFVSSRNTMLTAARSVGNALSSEYSLAQPFTAANKFEYELVSKLYGAGAFSGGQAMVNIVVTAFNNTTDKVMTFYFHKPGGLNYANAVTMVVEYENKNFLNWNYSTISYNSTPQSFSNIATCTGITKGENATLLRLRFPSTESGPYLSGYIKGIKAEDESEQNNCITCIEIDKQLDTFQQILGGVYGIKGKGHPYYEEAIRSFLNFKFYREHTTQDYLSLIEGCDLAKRRLLGNYYAYGYTSHIDTNELDKVCDAIRSYSSGKYKDFGNFYYYKTNGSNVITEGNLYIDFNTFEKRDIRNIMQHIASSTYVGTMQYNMLETQIRSNPLLLADLFVYHMPGAPDGPNPCIPSSSGNQASLSQNWVPNYSSMNARFCDNNPAYPPDYISYSQQIVTVKSGSMLSSYRHYHLDMLPLYGGNTEIISKVAFAYENNFLPDESRSFQSFLKAHYTANYQNVNDARKKDFLTYNFTKTYPANAYAKNQLIKELQPDYLKSQINGTGAYTTNFNGLEVLSYYNPLKGVNGGDLFVKQTLGGNNLGEINYVIARAGAVSGKNFPNNLEFDHQYSSNVKITVRRTLGNVVWYNMRNTITHEHKNIWIKFPDYFPADNMDIENMVFVGDPNNSLKLVPNPNDQRHFSLVAYYSPGTGTYHPSITLHGKTDFDLGTSDVYNNVMLCGDAPGIPEVISSCFENKITLAKTTGRMRYKSYIDSVRRSFITGLTKHVQQNIYDENLTIKLPQAKYAITMYGYDRAGNLAYTASPQSVVPWIADNAGSLVTESEMQKYKDYRGGMAKTFSSLDIRMPDATKYVHNSLNKVISKTTAEGGRTDYFHDELGRLVMSQTEQQRMDNRFSYIFYDQQGRVIETGTSKTDVSLIDRQRYINNFAAGPGDYQSLIIKKDRIDVIKTYYDNEKMDLSTQTGMSRQDFLRNRITSVGYYDKIYPLADASTPHTVAIHYSYDVAGNIKTLTYEMPALKDVNQHFKRIDYDYDLYSGKVNMVSYNRGGADQFYQKYEYDADNRIEKVETSKDGIIWDQDAKYTYYPHGPLARVQLGDLAVQGVDFVYTLQGWLKSTNGDKPSTVNDYGGDGYSNSNVQADLLRNRLYYFKEDYKPIDVKNYSNGSGTTMTVIPDLDQTATMQSLYNGNIAASMTIPGYLPALYTNYVYDQLNRIKSASYLVPDYAAAPASMLKQYKTPNFTGVATIPGQTGVLTEDVYKSTFSYDLDGNILSLKRYGLQANPSNPGAGRYNYNNGRVYLMDDLTYHYRLPKKRLLDNYQDASNHFAQTGFNNDLPNYTHANAATIRRMDYDLDGNMKSDMTNNINEIVWNGNGKVKEVWNGAMKRTTFGYDPLNNRFRKTIKDDVARTELDEYYIREASGNVLAIYRRHKHFVEQLPIKTTINNGFGGNLQWRNDVIGIWGGDASFVDKLTSGLLSASLETADNMINSRNVAFYLAGNSNIPQAMLHQATNVVSHVLTNSPALVKNPLNLAYDEQFFSAALYDTNNTNRTALLNLLVDSTDVAVMDSIITSLYPGSYVQNKAAFVTALEYALNSMPPVEITAVMKKHFTGPVLQRAVNRLLANTTFMQTTVPLEGYESMNTFLRGVIAQKAAPAELRTYLAARPDAATLLNTVATKQDKLAIIYDSDKVGFVNQVMALGTGADIMDRALMSIDGMSPTNFINSLMEYNPSSSIYKGSPYPLIINKDKTWLAEHVMYGSSRLGTQNFWPTQYSFEYDVSKNAEQNKLLREASPFHYRRGWYSYAYNGLIKSTEITPWGNAYVDKLGSSRILGLKRYELSNHLGNVQGVITDKITVAKQNQSATPPTPGVKRASLFASYDYYPFGMLMPERYVEDNTPQCIPTVRNGFVKQAIHIRDIPMDHTDAPHYMTNYGSNIQYTEGPPFQIKVTGMGARAHAFVSLPEGNLAPNKEFEFTTRTGRGDMLPSNVIVRVAQDDGTGNIVTLAQTNTLMMQSITLSATAISTEPLLVYYERPQINAVLLIEQGTYIVFDHVHADVIAQDCNSSDLGNDYRFGFNGQMKDNNLKGVGNSLDFSFRIHDARLGRFLSIDPISAKFPYLSKYQFAGNTPIWAKDLEGLEPGIDPSGLTYGMSDALTRKTMREEGKSPQAIQRYIEGYNNAALKGALFGAGAAITVQSIPNMFWWALSNPTAATEMTVGVLSAVAGYDGDVPGPYDDIGKGARGFFKFTENGLASASGLKWLNFRGYKVGPQTSVEHAFRHTRDDLSREVHGVFDKSGSALVDEIDDLFATATSKKWGTSSSETIDNVTRTVKKNGDINYTIDVGKRVGYNGGTKDYGKTLTTVRVAVTKDSELITAFPQ